MLALNSTGQNKPEKSTVVGTIKVASLLKLLGILHSEAYHSLAHTIDHLYSLLKAAVLFPGI